MRPAPWSVRAALLALAALPLAGTARAQSTPADHLVLSEVCYDGINEATSASSEYVEVFNPTAQTIDLSNVYLSDVPSDYILMTDSLYAPPSTLRVSLSNTHDFIYKFPQGATLAPGAVAVVTHDADTFIADLGFIDIADFLAVTGAQLFECNPDLPSAIDAAPDMEVIHSLSTASGSTNAKLNLTNSGETIVLFTWDGQAGGVVQDLDAVAWGPISNLLSKTGQSSPGGTAYKVDAGLSRPSLDPLLLPAPNTSTTLDPLSIQRINLIELGEVQSGGNGATGHDESTEDLVLTWEPRSLSPGTVPFGTGTVAVDPVGPIDFGVTPFGQSFKLPVKIENTGAVVLSLKALRIAAASGKDDATAEYHVDASGLPLAIAPGQSVTRDVTFTASAQAAGLREVDLLVDTSDAQSPSVAVRVIGEGAQPPSMGVSQSALAFQSTLVGDARTLGITFTNQGVADLRITALSIDPAGGPFELSDASAATITPQGPVTRQITFRPGGAGDFQATLTITSNDPTNPTRTITLTGTGLALPSGLTRSGGSGGGGCTHGGDAPSSGALLLAALALLGLAMRRR